MKIAQIAPPWIAIPPKNYGGTEIVLHNLVEEQVAQGHDVTLFAPADARTSAKLVSFFPMSLIDAGVPWHAHLKAYYHLHKSIEYIKTHQFDIVHAHLSSSADMYIFPLAVQLTVPLVVTLHSRFPFDRVPPYSGDADDYYLEWLASTPIVAISESARAEIPHALNLAGVIHHGVPMHIFRPAVSYPEDYLVWLGRMVPEKGAHLAIQVAKGCEAPLLLAGTIDRHVPASVRYFEDKIKPQLNHHLIKYIGPVNLKQKIDLLSRARVLLNPIEWEEPFGMVMIEAMAVGCPVISFRRGAAPEVVAHQTSGFLVHNVKEMLRALAHIDELDRKMVRRHVELHFSVRVMAEKYTRIYQNVIATSLSKLPKIAAGTSVLAYSPDPSFTRRKS